MEPWCRSNITLQRVEGLVRCGLLYARTAAEEWRLPGDEDVPSPPDGYVMSFAHFHERGFTTPAHKFLRGLLNYYKVELQHLTPNGVQHIVAFIALCEGFLGISPHFDLWRYFFAVTLLKKREKKQELNVLMGCIGIQLHNNRVSEYLPMHLSTSNKEWHSHWFYVKSDAAIPLLELTRCFIEEILESWRRWGSRRKIRRESRTISSPSES